MDQSTDQLEIPTAQEDINTKEVNIVDFFKVLAVIAGEAFRLIEENKETINELRLIIGNLLFDIYNALSVIVSQISPDDIKQFYEKLIKYKITLEQYISLMEKLGWPAPTTLNILQIEQILHTLKENNKVEDLSTYTPTETDIEFVEQYIVTVLADDPEWVKMQEKIWTDNILVKDDSNLTRILEEVMWCFLNGKYFSSVSTILPVFEAILIKLNSMSKNPIIDPSKVSKKTTESKLLDRKLSKRQCVEMFKKIFNTHTTPSHVYLNNFVEHFFYSSESDRQKNHRKYYKFDFNRHSIVHGEYIDYGNIVVALKSIILMSHMLSNLNYFIDENGIVHSVLCDEFDINKALFFKVSYQNTNKCTKCISTDM